MAEYLSQEGKSVKVNYEKVNSDFKNEEEREKVTELLNNIKKAFDAEVKEAEDGDGIFELGESSENIQKAAQEFMALYATDVEAALIATRSVNEFTESACGDMMAYLNTTEAFDPGFRETVTTNWQKFRNTRMQARVNMRSPDEVATLLPVGQEITRDNQSYVGAAIADQYRGELNALRPTNTYEQVESALNGRNQIELAKILGSLIGEYEQCLANAKKEPARAEEHLQMAASRLQVIRNINQYGKEHVGNWTFQKLSAGYWRVP